MGKIIRNGIEYSGSTDMTKIVADLFDTTKIYKTGEFVIYNGILYENINGRKPNDFSETETYDVGDKVTYGNAYYECNTAISTPGPWNSIYWDVVTISGGWVASEWRQSLVCDKFVVLDNALDDASDNGVKNKVVTQSINQINADLSAKALVNTYYDTTAKKLYLVNADGTKGSEIPMSNMQPNYYIPTRGDEAISTVDLSNFNNSTQITIGVGYGAQVGGGVSSGKALRKVSVSTIKTWTDYIFIESQTNIGSYFKYANGKLYIKGSSGNSCNVWIFVNA